MDVEWQNVVSKGHLTIREVVSLSGYTPEQLKALLDDAGFAQTEIHRKKPMYATILGVKP